jgi:L-fuculokinase
MDAALIFDIGKTNKKALVFGCNYQVLWQESKVFDEIQDEDQYPADNINGISAWILSVYENVLHDTRFLIKAVNFSTYGASWLAVDQNGQPLGYLYNYLKPIKSEVESQFLAKYGPLEPLCSETASPWLGHLNSGMQLYSHKYLRPQFYQKASFFLHLPNFFAFLLCQKPCSEITSIGCHTLLWHFDQNNYHSWVVKEKLNDKLAPIAQGNSPLASKNGIQFGTGLHDSSAALVPYLATVPQPFILLSTGTWNICLNPFNNSALTIQDLAQDCLSFYTYQGQPVKASRLFAGHEHGLVVEQMAQKFAVTSSTITATNYATAKQALPESYGWQYLQYMQDLVNRQVLAIELVMTKNVKQLFVDGGFSKNDIFMQLLAQALPNISIFAADLAQASALGAAMAIHRHWNNSKIKQPISLIPYGSTTKL